MAWNRSQLGTCLVPAVGIQLPKADSAWEPISLDALTAFLNPCSDALYRLRMVEHSHDWGTWLQGRVHTAGMHGTSPIRPSI